MSINKKGFTLIELTIYLSIAIIFLLGTVDFILTINSIRQRGFIVAEVENQGLRMMTAITDQIRNSSGINSPAGTGSVLSLVSKNVNTNPIIFSVVNNKLQMAEGDNAAVILHNDLVQVEGFYLQNSSRTDTKGSIRIELILKFKSDSEDPKKNYRQTFYGSATVR